MFALLIKSKKQQKRIKEAWFKEQKYLEQFPYEIQQIVPSRRECNIDWDKRQHVIEVDKNGFITGRDFWRHYIEIKYKPIDYIHKKYIFDIFMRNYDKSRD